MDSAKGNPSTNKVGSGVTDTKIEQAIKSSGYPLQLTVSQALSKDFSLQEEWSFIDLNTKSTRTIDIVASKKLFKYKEPQSRIRPSLNLVIECKQSDLPYIFFLSGSHTWLQNFPIISGLKTNSIVLTTDDDPSTWSYKPLQLLGLSNHPFLTKSAPHCMTFSKCVRKGSNLVLSGSDPYQNLVLPILQATNHFDTVQKPSPTAFYFDCRMVIGLGVLDAPMIGVRLTDTGTKIELLPWVRVLRHQTLDGVGKLDRTQVFGIDIIHKDFLQKYLTEHVLPFANKFSGLALKHPDVLADARGFVAGLGENWWPDVEPRLKPRTRISTINRWKGGINKIFSIFKRRK